jgi:HAD superfamily phosphoserine phosphatase-like hydrolase
MLNFQTKIVVFDFDGTIATSSDGLTTWENLWIEAGYTANDCANFHAQFRKGAISHDQWCSITLEKFRAKGMNLSIVKRVASRVKIVDGFEEVVENLYSRNIKMYILSGSIRDIIDASLEKHLNRFQEIRANEFEYDEKNALIKIVGTKYDFAGKAEYIRRIVSERSCSPMDVLFVGNAGNDSWASRSGARTLCVNPTSTDPDNPKQWTNSIRMRKDMREILPDVKSRKYCDSGDWR